MDEQKRRVYDFGPYRLDPVKRVLLKDGLPVQLTPKAIDTLLALVEERGHLIQKEVLINRIWPDSFVEEGNLAVMISTLRKALGENRSERRYIVTIPGKGYRFVSDVKEIFGEDIDFIAQETTRSRILIESEEAEGLETGEKSAPLQSELALEFQERTREKTWIRIKLRRKVIALTCILIVVLILAGIGTRMIMRPNTEAVDSVAILPFINEIQDEGMDYLSESFADMLISDLSRLSELKVISRNSISRYKGQEIDPIKVGSDLKVRAILTGKLYKAGNQLNLSVELTDTRDRSILWSEHYTQKTSDILSLQQDVSRKVIEKLRRGLKNTDRNILPHNTSDNPAAYELYIKGQWYWNKRTGDAARQAVEYFQQAIDLDPSYALAYSGLANAYVLNSSGQPRDSYMRAKKAAERALELDDTLGEAHTTLGFIRSHYERDWVNAGREFLQAMELNPNYATAHLWYADYLLVQGQFDQAFQELKRAQELDPLSPIINADVGLYYFYTRQYDQAINYFERMTGLFPNSFPVYYYLGWAYTQKGMYAEAISQYQKAQSITKGHSMVTAMLGYTYALSGNSALAQETINELNSLALREYVSPYRFAILYTGTGQKDLAFEWLNKAYDELDILLVNVNVSPFFDSLREDPRFADLLQRLSLMPK